MSAPHQHTCQICSQIWDCTEEGDGSDTDCRWYGAVVCPPCRTLLKYDGNPEVLRIASNLVERYAATLDRTRSACRQCGVYHYVDFTAFQSYQELEAIVRKLRNQANAADARPRKDNQ